MRTLFNICVFLFVISIIVHGVLVIYDYLLKTERIKKWRKIAQISGFVLLAIAFILSRGF